MPCHFIRKHTKVLHRPGSASIYLFVFLHAMRGKTWQSLLLVLSLLTLTSPHSIGSKQTKKTASLRISNLLVFFKNFLNNHPFLVTSWKWCFSRQDMTLRQKRPKAVYPVGASLWSTRFAAWKGSCVVLWGGGMKKWAKQPVGKWLESPSPSHLPNCFRWTLWLHLRHCLWCNGAGMWRHLV